MFRRPMWFVKPFAVTGAGPIVGTVAVASQFEGSKGKDSGKAAACSLHKALAGAGCHSWRPFAAACWLMQSFDPA